jgi:hypothetical protein
MKKILLTLLAIVTLISCNNLNNLHSDNELTNKINSKFKTDKTPITLSEITDFEYDNYLILEPYSIIKNTEETYKIDLSSISENGIESLDSFNLLVFIKDKKAIKICELNRDVQLNDEKSLNEDKNEIITNQKTLVPDSFDDKLNVKQNLIYAENDKLIIKIDRYNDDTLRYISWNKQKTEKPTLILSNGIVEKQGSMGGYIYTFQNQDLTYIINDVQMGETEESMGVFLKLIQNEKEISNTKMTSLKK